MEILTHTSHQILATQSPCCALLYQQEEGSSSGSMNIWVQQVSQPSDFANGHGQLTTI